MYQRSVTEFDRQRKKLEREHRELLVKVNHLTDEVGPNTLAAMRIADRHAT